MIAATLIFSQQTYRLLITQEGRTMKKIVPKQGETEFKWRDFPYKFLHSGIFGVVFLADFARTYFHELPFL